MSLVITLALALTGTPPPIEIQLSSPKREFRGGEEIVMAAQVRNLTDQPIAMVTEQDSMNWGRKAPFCTIEVLQPDGQWVPALMKDVGRCGNANPIKKSDFIQIPAKSKAEILQGMPWSRYEVTHALEKKGFYTLRLRYDSRPKLASWVGGPLMPEAESALIEEIRPLYEKTPKGVFISNAVTIRVL